jgi:hypothetical protein
MGHPSISSSHLMASNSQASQRVLPAMAGRASVGECHAGRNFAGEVGAAGYLNGRLFLFRDDRIDLFLMQARR